MFKNLWRTIVVSVIIGFSVSVAVTYVINKQKRESEQSAFDRGYQEGLDSPLAKVKEREHAAFEKGFSMGYISGRGQKSGPCTIIIPPPTK